MIATLSFSTRSCAPSILSAIFSDTPRTSLAVPACALAESAIASILSLLCLLSVLITNIATKQVSKQNTNWNNTAANDGLSDIIKYSTRYIILKTIAVADPIILFLTSWNSNTRITIGNINAYRYISSTLVSSTPPYAIPEE